MDARQERLVSIPMRIGAQVLAAVTVAGPRLMFPDRYADADARVAKGRGAFFTRGQIDSLQPYDITSLMASIPTVHLNDRGVYFARCNTGAEFGSEGRVQVYVDGVRMTNYQRHLPDAGFEVNSAMQSVKIPSIQLIEVYSSISTIPVEYLDDACAVILIWTT